MSVEVREPAVAGRFYPANPEQLLADIQSYVPTGEELLHKISAIGCIVPHAGYMYSGHVAAAVYDRLDLPRHYVILCPNHTGAGHPLAIMSQGEWRTPLGNVRIDSELAQQLMAEFPELGEDLQAHRGEHALEVQLPFLQALRGDFHFVPIVVGTGEFETLTSLGEAMAKVIAKSSERIMVIASSDMNHYEDDSTTRAKDRAAINRILALDAAGLYRVIHDMNVTMCGYGPAIAMLTAARDLEADGAQLIKYATSGDISGDRSYVVGYAGIVVS